VDDSDEEVSAQAAMDFARTGGFLESMVSIRRKYKWTATKY
jgi:hypothetical protein